MIPVFEYKVNAMVEVNEDGTVSIVRDVFLRVGIIVHLVMVIMQSIKRPWPWSSKPLGSMPDHDLRTVESWRAVLFPLPLVEMERLGRVDVQHIVSGTW